MNWINFSKYENADSKFTANLSEKGGYITFSNSGKGGDKKFFTVSLESFLICLRDILENHKAFLGNEVYDEKKWRDLGNKYFSDPPAKAQITVQTKPMFATLSKIVMWANGPKHDANNPEENIILEKASIETAITKLEELSTEFIPKSFRSPSSKSISTKIEKFDPTPLINALKTSELIFLKSTVLRFLSSLLTKPFTILTGLSGSGKTKLAQAFIKWISESNAQYSIIPIGADWTNREPLLGYPNALEKNQYIKPDSGALSLILEASKAENQSKPYFLILDEMNLSHVERYFADFLSAMESGEPIPLHNGNENWGDVPPTIALPKNLFIIGTVNIDETTYMFSPKVLDRANVIEFRITEQEMETYLSGSTTLNLDELNAQGVNMAASFVAISNDKSLQPENTSKLREELLKFFTELKKTGAEFGYRSASEIYRFAAVVNRLDPSWELSQIIDAAIVQKLLPKVHGSRRKLEPVLKALGGLCLNNPEDFENYIKNGVANNGVKYPVSLEKISRMYHALLHNGFTSYAEA